jgi:hypothetical protein
MRAMTVLNPVNYMLPLVSERARCKDVRKVYPTRPRLCYYMLDSFTIYVKR